jgi:hypothetical protein
VAAQQIHHIITRRDPMGRREITHVGGVLPSGERWRLTVEEAIAAVRAGTIYFVTLEGESYIVAVGTDPSGRRFLRTALGESDSSMLLRLPESS